VSALAVRAAAWLRRALPALFGLAGLISASWATGLNLAEARADRAEASPSAAMPAPAEGERLALDPSEVALPEYTVSGPQAVSRLANPHTSMPRRARVDVVRYTVQPGDAIFAIADEFGIKPETILWGNYDVLNDDPHLLRPGQELNILPVDGTYYQWQAGDNLDAVAGFFGVTAEDILDWPGNALDPSDPASIDAGKWLVVPGGHRELRTWTVPTIARGSAGVGGGLGPGACSGDYTGGAVGTGGFIWPTGNHYLSGNDYWSGHLAIDIAAGLGSSVWAADGGVIVFAGWSTVGYGNMIMIDHGNGWQTLYAHLSTVSVGCGQSVSQGQSIGGAGSTGNSSGPHLHFETRYEGGFVNPWYVLP
jgi:murein DD-endopeptidase MepM/ murein hydrolase activator NlpD